MGYSRKNQTGVYVCVCVCVCGGGVAGGGLRIWNFQGYQRNRMWNFQGLYKNKVEFSKVAKKKQCGISRGLSFWPWDFQGI